MSSATANKLSMSREDADNYATLIINELNLENRTYIEQSQVETLCKESFSQIHLPVDQMPATSAVNSDDKRDHKTMSLAEVLFRTYWRRAWVVLCWLIVCFALFTWKFMQYRHRMAFEVMGYCLCTAKGAAETLKFNMALILLPVCRNTVTWLRKNHSLNSFFPFNDNINFHKLVAGGIVIGVILHGGTHLTCDFPRIASCSRSTFQNTIAIDFQFHQPSYIEILATTEVATGIAMVLLMAIAFSLATQLPRCHPSALLSPLQKFIGFNTFWYSHHLFIIVYVLLLVHSMFLFLTKDIAEKTTWMYIVIPVILYAGERLIRAFRSKFYDTKVIMAKTYPGKVLSLKLSKPSGFQYRSGMYIFIQCPKISTFEWHPFSLTSALKDDHLSVHIRALGDWSYQIYCLFQEALTSGKPEFPRIYVDGPYGAASQDHVKYDIVVLIGLGIGATPFVSVIKDIIHAQQVDLNDAIIDTESNIKRSPAKAYLYWVTRERSSFDWFKDVMQQISKTHERQAIVEMHNYLTSVYREGDAKALLSVQTHFSRPNWFTIFSKLARSHEGATIGVFYCGPSVLAKDLQRCDVFLWALGLTKYDLVCELAFYFYLSEEQSDHRALRDDLRLDQEFSDNRDPRDDHSPGVHLQLVVVGLVDVVHQGLVDMD
ncbi:hypothetical protein Sjap_015410 [Stephania japonica]|uniref:FAD-binding FR-type domain-containing protein n=1 Tax=Stephania japonica TaxID=461633 RepID=A0AAP0IK57_9MAGN